MKRYIFLLALLAAGLTVSARSVFPLNEGWRFYFKSEMTADGARHVTLPHSWNTDPRAGSLFVETTGNYQNDMYIPVEWASKRIFVKFYGVQTVADLFVNGRHAGSHAGGGTAFVFEITDKVRFGADNALLMVVSNASRSDVLPTSTDINLYGGIYREAELILTDRTVISPLYFGSDGVLVRTAEVDAGKAEGEIEVHIDSKSGRPCMLSLAVAAADGRTVFSRQQRIRPDGEPVRVPFSVEKPMLWSPEQPALYDVTAIVADDESADTVRVRTGFRAVRVDAADGLSINGVVRTVQGVVLHHDNAFSGGTLSAGDYDADLRVVADIGATAVRSAVMPHAPYFYDRCDEQGLLVWIDLPFHRAFLGDAAYFSTPQFEQNGLRQLQEIIIQHFNHPSVVMWGLFSHLWQRGDDPSAYLRRLNDTAHRLDPSRPTAACSDQDGTINFITDLIIWHQDVGWKRGTTDDVRIWRDNLQRGWSYLRSAVCYGGSGIIGHKRYTAQGAPQANWLPEERQTRFHEEYSRNLQNDSLFWGVWIANLFDYGSARRPYGINCDGLVTLDRRDRKDAYYLYRALWNRRQPTLYITDRHHTLRDGVRQTFRVYSSAGAPVMLIGPDTVAMSEYAACQYRSDTVELNGKVEVKVMAGALRDSVTLRVGNVLKPQRQPGLLRTANPPSTN